MRLLSIKLAFLVAILVSACDFWPKDLKPLAESISRQVSGETTAWLVSGDIIVINVAASPHYPAAQSKLETLATEIAEQAIGFSESPLEAIAITFYEGEVSENPEKMREFIFLVIEKRPVLQPHVDVDASGPLTIEEVLTIFERVGESLPAEQRDCVLEEVEKRARVAGDPETLDPKSVKFLSAETWYGLDAFGKRLILAQAIMTKALFDCASTRNAEVNSRWNRIRLAAKSSPVQNQPEDRGADSPVMTFGLETAFLIARKSWT